MAMKVAVTYTNGKFVPENPLELEEGARGWIEVTSGLPALDEAERVFALAFARGELEEARVKEGCRLAWDATRESVAKAVRARGWAHATDNDLRRAMSQIDKLESRGDSNEKLSLYPLFRAGEIFRDRANAPFGDRAPFLLEEWWQFADGLEMTRELIAAMSGSCEGGAA